MEEEKSHIHYSAEYIRKYLEGELSTPEMLALEKAALEDPFLSDAIEGYEESRRHPLSFESGVEILQKKLAQRIAEKDMKSVFVRKITKWQVAASVLVILGAALFSLIIVNKTKKAELSDRIVIDSNVRENVPLPAKVDTTGTAYNITLPTNSKLDTLVSANTRSLSDEVHVNRVAKTYPSAKKSAETTTGQEEPVINREEKHRQNDMDENDSARLKHRENVMDESNSARPYSSNPTDSSMKKASAVTAAKINEQAIEGPKPEGAMVSGYVSGLALEKDKNLTGAMLIGQVVNEKNKPIPFAAVSIKGTKRRTLTDTSGFFKLYMKNPSLATLVFTNPGDNEPMSAELISDSANINKFRLRESELKKTDTAAGWAAFSQFINNNKKIVTADSLLKGDEIISFLVYPDGNLTSFKIVKSISPAHDAEIFRLIKLAPALKPLQDKKQKCRLTVSFK